MNNLRYALMISALFIFAMTCAAQSNSTESDEGSVDQLNGSTSAISVIASVSPVEAMDVDFVTFTYDVVNEGTTDLCNITINNSIAGVEFVEPFDLKSGENATRTAGYELTAEDREQPYIFNHVTATGYDCEDGRQVTAATAGCTILLS